MSRGLRRTMVSIALGCACALVSAGTAAAVDRSTADRADDALGLDQVHVVYALPLDGTDHSLDMDDDITASVDAWEKWLRGQAGGRGLRLDTFGGGVLDVTFVRLSKTEAELKQPVGAPPNDPYIRTRIEDDMRAKGLIAPNKIYAVYYDGEANLTCASGAYPPTVPGQVGALYLDGLHGSGPGACGLQPFPPPDVDTPGYLDFAMVHEMFHVMGFVPSCAPHVVFSGHVPDTNDLMYTGAAPWSLPPTLDVGHDDYFATGSSSCPDFASSFFREGNVRPPPSATPTAAAATPKKCKKGQKRKRGKCVKKKKKK